MTRPLRHLVLILGDQLDEDASALDGFDPAQDLLWMAEVEEESTHVPSSKQRTTLFLSAMRHFAELLHARGWPLVYRRIDAAGNTGTLAGELARSLAERKPQRLVMTAPGDWRVLQALRGVAQAQGLELELRDDRHFFCTVREFARHAEGRKSLRMEFFYREMRHKTGVLMEGGKPLGGEWNYDTENRGSFGKAGPGPVPAPTRFAPDAITREVMALVNERFAGNPGTNDSFAWPVTRAQALQVLEDFVAQRLPSFGLYQDAMWAGEAWLYHAHVSSSLNLKLLNPREVVSAAEHAYHAGRAPLAAVEGFIRQVLGWREYVRGLYWTRMPALAQGNALEAQAPLPAFFWSGETDMACLRDALAQTLREGYAHHIQRLMVTGLYALLLGAAPREVHQWYLGVYVDAIEWVELPNTLGMSQYADGGLMASKPYAATGKYLQRMGPQCQGCRFDPAQRVGARACPFTTLYWDFLLRHETTLAGNARMALQVKNLARLGEADRAAIRDRSAAIRRGEVGAVHAM